jgi:zinc transport system substrate-binding protein
MPPRRTMIRTPLAPGAIALVVLAGAVAASAAGLGLAAASSQAPGAHPGPLRVVATIFPVADIVEEIGGDLVTVSTVVPAGADPHNFELTPTIARAIGEADMVVSVAAAFDGWAVPDSKHTGLDRGELSRAVTRPEGSPAALTLEPALRDSLIPLGGGSNPHFWLDPLVAREIAKLVASELGRLDAPNREVYEARTRVFAARIDSLDASVRARLERLPARDYAAVHPAWTYFARRYGLNERSVLERAPEQEPSAKWIARVLREMKRDKVKLVVAEEFSNMALATMVAKEAGARLVVLDPLGGKTRPGRDSYFALMDYNVTRLEEALEGLR